MWIYYVNPDNTFTLTSYDSSLYLVLNVNLNAITYKDMVTTDRDNFVNYYMKSTGADSNETISITVNDSIRRKYESYDVGKEPDGFNEPDSAVVNTNWVKVEINKMETDDGVDYTVKQWGRNSNINIYALRDNYEFTIEADDTEVAVKDIYKVSDFVNYYLTTVAGEKVYIGGGAPFLRVEDPKDRK